MKASGFSSSVIWTVTGKTGESLLRFGGNLILTRLLVPEQFGMMSIAQSVILMIELLTDFGIRTALIQNPGTDNRNLMNAAWWLSAVRGLSLMVLLMLLSPFLAGFFHETDLTVLLQVLSISLVINGLMNPGVAVLAKSLNIKRMVMWELGSQIAGVFVTLSFSFLLPSVWALVAGFLTTSIVRFIWSWHLHEFRPAISLDRQQLSSLIRISSLLMVNTIFTWLTMNMDRFLIGRAGGMELLGIYMIAFNLTLIIEQVMVQIFARVTFPAISAHRNNQDETIRLIRRSLLMAGVGGLPLLFILAVSADGIIDFLYSSVWKHAAFFMILIAIRSSFNLFSAVISGTLMAVGQTNKVTLAMVAGFVVNLIVAGGLFLFTGSPDILVGGLIAGSVTVTISLYLSATRLVKGFTEAVHSAIRPVIFVNSLLAIGIFMIVPLQSAIHIPLTGFVLQLVFLAVILLLSWPYLRSRLWL